MIDNLLILPDDPSHEALWAQRQRDGGIRMQRGPLSDLEATVTTPFAAILPGQHVRAFLTDLPSSLKSAERLNMARYAHEEQLAVSPEALHIVIGDTDPAQTLMVDHEVMRAVLERLDPAHIFVDYDALAGLEAENIGLLDRVVTPGSQGFTVDRDWAEGPVTQFDDETQVRAMFARLESGAALNLRSGSYRRRANLQTGPWARVAAALLLCVGLGLGLSYMDARAKQAQADALEAQARTLYTQVTGQAAPANLSGLARQAGANTQNPESFLALSERLFVALSEHPDIQIERLSFDASEDSLRLRLIYPGFEAASALEETVDNLGADFATGGVRKQNGQFIGDAALRLGAGS